MSLKKALKMNKAIILDRDGTLVYDLGYVHKVEDFGLLPGVTEGLKRLSEEFVFIIITNQSGIGRGIHTEAEMHKFNKKLISELRKKNIKIKKIYYCPHRPEEVCECRKPSTKHIKQAAEDFNFYLKSSWVIGDHPHDIEMGTKAGCRAVYLLTGHGKKHFDDLKKNNIKPDFIAENFIDASNFIMNSLK